MSTEIARLVAGADEAAAIVFFVGKSEPERLALAPAALMAYREESKIRARPDGRSFGYGEGFSAAGVAVLACGTLPELKKLRVVSDIPTVLAVMRDRRPAWLDDWVAWWCEENPFGWRAVRALIRDGSCAAPRSDAYVTAMIVGLCGYAERNTVLAALGEDRELLQDEVWRLFEVEGDGERTLAARDKYSRGDNSWGHALLTLAQEGTLPRARLLDATLGALARDFKQFHAGWFSRFHEDLKPTPAERGARADAYLALLASKIPPTVTFAVCAVTEIQAAGAIDGAKLIAALRPALWSRAKGTVKAALKLVASVAKRTPALASEAALMAVEALQCESADVQKAVLGLLNVPAPGLAEALSRHSGTLVPSLREKFAALATVPSAEPAPVHDGDALVARARGLPARWAKLAGVDDALQALDTGPARALAFTPLEVPRISPGRAIAAIADLDALLDAFARVLEEPGDVPEVERVLDGVSRLCDRRPPAFATLTAPLARRARQLAARTGEAGQRVLASLCELASAWLDGARPSPDAGSARDIVDALQARVRELATRVAAGEAAPLLAAPTHAGAWIDPRVLVARATAAPHAGALDRVFSLLRIAPDGRGEALAAAADVPGEWGAALRHALGAQPAERGPTAGLWAAADACRTPGSGPFTYEVVRHVTSGYEFICLSVAHDPPREGPAPADRPTDLLVLRKPLNRWDHEVTGTAEIRWADSVWPAWPEARLAAAARRLVDNLDWWEARWDARTHLEPLLDPDLPLTPMATLLLVVGLAAKDPGESGLAVDALIAAIDDGRADAERLGAVGADLLPTGLIKGARWARTLGQAARVSALHAFTIGRLIQRMLRGDPANAPRDVGGLLELLRELLAEVGEGVADPEARAWLERFPGKGRTGKLARDLLAVGGEITAAHITLRALEGRVARAERWSVSAGPSGGSAPGTGTPRSPG